MYKIILLPFFAGVVNMTVMLCVSHFDITFEDVSSRIEAMSSTSEVTDETPQETSTVVPQPGDDKDATASSETISTTADVAFVNATDVLSSPAVAGTDALVKSPSGGTTVVSQQAPVRPARPRDDRELKAPIAPRPLQERTPDGGHAVPRKPEYAKFITGPNGEVTQGFFREATNTMIVAHREAVTVDAGAYPYFENEWRLDDYPGFCGTIIRVRRNDTMTVWAPAIGGPAAELLSPVAELGQERIFSEETDLPEGFDATAWIVCVDRHLEGERPFERSNLLGWLNNLSLGDGSNIS